MYSNNVITISMGWNMGMSIFNGEERNPPSKLLHQQRGVRRLLPKRNPPPTKSSVHSPYADEMQVSYSRDSLLSLLQKITDIHGNWLRYPNKSHLHRPVTASRASNLLALPVWFRHIMFSRRQF